MMKKLILLFIITMIIAGVYTHEVSFVYSAIERDPSNATDEKGWLLNFAALRWGNNDFSDYAFSVLLTKYASTLRTDLDLAWLRLKIMKDLEMRVGMQYYDFGKVSSSGSC
jgi:hypothetical protein